MAMPPKATAETRTVSLGFSPCPNDTFLFHALVHDRVSADGLAFFPRLEDVETLNRMALQAELDVTKVSYAALPHLLDDYVLLRSGGALGRGSGPLVVAREPLPPESLREARLGIPGRYTTANLLLRLYDPAIPPAIEMAYSQILPAVAGGALDAGVIIHESRFTYPEYGLRKVVDLGEWWEQLTGAPIPLGAIVARRSLGEQIPRIDQAIRRSVEYALAHPAASQPYVAAHAQEMSPGVMRRHIELYVNPYSVDLGPEGEAAVAELMQRAKATGYAPESLALRSADADSRTDDLLRTI